MPRLRRRPTAVSMAAVLAVPLLLAGGCSGGDDIEVTVKGPFGTRPEVTFPDEPPGGELAVATVTEGEGGGGAVKGDLVIADYVGYRWNKDGTKLLVNSFITGRPGAFPTGRLVPGLERALRGAKPGDRVVAKIPPRDGYGDKGDTQRRVGAGDTLLYVLDVRAVHPKTARAEGRPAPLNDPRLPRVADRGGGGEPAMTLPKGAPPKTLQARVVVQGEGEPVAKGRLLALQYMGMFWRDGRVFDSSWRAGRPYATTIGTGQVIKGWDQALAGQRVGSRMLLVVPPSLGYGKQGLPQAGIRGDDTLVFLVDILGAH